MHQHTWLLIPITWLPHLLRWLSCIRKCWIPDYWWLSFDYNTSYVALLSRRCGVTVSAYLTVVTYHLITIHLTFSLLYLQVPSSRAAWKRPWPRSSVRTRPTAAVPMERPPLVDLSRPAVASSWNGEVSHSVLPLMVSQYLNALLKSPGPHLSIEWGPFDMILKKCRTSFIQYTIVGSLWYLKSSVGPHFINIIL